MAGFAHSVSGWEEGGCLIENIVNVSKHARDNCGLGIQLPASVEYVLS